MLDWTADHVTRALNWAARLVDRLTGHEQLLAVRLHRGYVAALKTGGHLELHGVTDDGRPLYTVSAEVDNDPGA